MKRIIVLTIILTASFSLIVLAEGEKRPAAFSQPQADVRTPAQPQPLQLPAEANNLKFPYVGEITGSEINIRSGPGMNFYGCGKISAPARVVVVDQKYSWSKILPPPGSFSWIFRQYVETDPNNPNIGTVNADNVRVYAGSDDIEPIRSDSVQISLSTGQKVRIIGDAVGDYYKIAPPEGSCVWTTSQYVKYIRSADEIDVKIPQKPGADANASGTPELITEQVENRSQQLEQYYTIEKQFEDEKKKPLESQDYSKIKAEIAALIADPNSGKAGEYAQYLTKGIERCELAKESITILESQNTELQNQLTEIDKAHQEKKKTITDISKYAIQGTFRRSVVYEGQPSGERYLIIDDNNKPICYAEAVGEAADANLADYCEQKVGLIGQISADTQSHIALVKFEKIEKIEKLETEAATLDDPNAKERSPRRS